MRVDGVVAATGAGSTYALVDPDAREGKSYTYRIEAEDSGGHVDTLGDYVREPFALRVRGPIGMVGETAIVIRWLSRPGHEYRVLGTTSLKDRFLLLATVPATPPQNVHTQRIVGLPTHFFRIEEGSAPGTDQ